VLVTFIDLERTIDERFHRGQVGERFGVALRERDRGAPCGAGPIEEPRIRARHAGERATRFDSQLLDRDAETAQPVVTAAPIETSRAILQVDGSRDVALLRLVGFLLHERVRVLREAACGGEQQPLVRGRLGDEALGELQAERDRGPHELGIVVGRVHRPSFRDGIGESIDG
jgi:hypothetical protein